MLRGLKDLENLPVFDEELGVAKCPASIAPGAGPLRGACSLLSPAAPSSPDSIALGGLLQGSFPPCLTSPPASWLPGVTSGTNQILILGV